MERPFASHSRLNMRKHSILVQVAKQASVYAPSKKLWDKYPYLKLVTESLINHFGDFQHTSGQRINVLAVQKARTEYLTAQQSGLPEKTLFIRYLNVLFESYAEACLRTAKNREMLWYPTHDVSFSAFALNNKIDYEINPRFSKEKITNKLVNKFIADADAIRSLEEGRND